MTNASFETIEAVLKATNNLVVDDHFTDVPNHPFVETKLAAIAEIEGTVVGIVAPNDCFPTMGLNKLYIGEDNRVHVSKLGVAVLTVYNGNIQAAIAKYNEAIVTTNMRKFLHKRQISNPVYF